MQIRGFGSLDGLGSKRTFALRIQPRRVSGVGRSSSFIDPARDLARRLVALRDSAEQLKQAVGLRDRSATSTSGSFSGVLVSSRLGRTTGPTSGPVEPRPPTEGPTEPRVLRSDPIQAPSAQPEGASKGFDRGSTAEVTFGGTYDGSQGNAAALTFRVRRGGEVGQDDVQLEVRDGRGEKLETVKVDREEAGDTFLLSNGIELALSPGTLDKNDTLTLNVSTGDGSVDPTRAFGGSGLAGGAEAVNAEFQKGSTAPVTVGGSFSGPFDDTLTFKVKDGGSVGEDDLEFEVRGSDGRRLESVALDAGERTATLENGLTLTLGEGRIEKKDTFTVVVEARDELAPAEDRRVQAGSFSVNEVTIQVEETDSIDSVLAKISASGAGVSARFDADTQTVELRPDAASDQGIRLADDTSGFLAAAGLEGKGLAPPSEPSTDPPVAPPQPGVARPDVPGTDAVDERLAGVRPGAFHINGRSIQVNVESDSLEDVVERINAADAGVEAEVRGGRLELRSLERGATLEVEDGSSGFFRALGIEAGVYAPTADEAEQAPPQEPRLATPNTFRDVLTDFSAALRGVASQRSGGNGLPDAQAAIAASIRAALGQAGGGAQSTLDTELGLSFRLSDGNVGLDLDFAGVDRALARSSADFASFFTEGRDSDGRAQGLLDSITDAVDSTLSDLAVQLDPGQDAGLLFDIQA